MLAMMPLLLAQDAPEPGPVVKGAPYSAQAITETTQTLADGSHIDHKSTSMIYRDSDGRERREGPQTVLILDPVARVNYTLDVNRRTAHRIMITPPPPPPPTKDGGSIRIEGGITITGAMITPQTVSPIAVGTVVNGASLTPAKVEHLGTMTIEGVEAEGTRTTADQVSERWYSPELKAAVLTRQIDPRMGETVYRLTQINRGEPDHSLFEIPAGYTVVQ